MCFNCIRCCIDRYCNNGDVEQIRNKKYYSLLRICVLCCIRVYNTKLFNPNKEVMRVLDKIEENVNLYFVSKASFLVTEIMKIYNNTEDETIKIKCLNLLNEIEG